MWKVYFSAHFFNGMRKKLSPFYLADHADEYGANLDSVFVSGGSAGGHLTCITALAIANGSFPSIFTWKANYQKFLRLQSYISFLSHRNI